MSRIAWIKAGAVAALWTIIGAAAVSGWLIGKGESANQIAELRQRLALDMRPNQACGVGIELLEVRGGRTAAPANLFGVALGGILPRGPHHLHLREMLTSR